MWQSIFAFEPSAETLMPKRQDSHDIITSPSVILIPDILAYCMHCTDRCSPYTPIPSRMRIFCHFEGLKEQVRVEGCDHPNRSLRRHFQGVLGRKTRQPKCPWSLQQKQKQKTQT